MPSARLLRVKATIPVLLSSSPNRDLLTSKTYPTVRKNDDFTAEPVTVKETISIVPGARHHDCLILLDTVLPYGG